MAGYYTPKMPPDWVLEKIQTTLAFNETGDLIWSRTVSSNAQVGAIAGVVDDDGYRFLSFQKGDLQRRVSGHHIVWFLKYNEWPTAEINHINGNPSDNRIENLELSNRFMQMWKASPPSNSLGFTGVEKLPYGRYRARLRVSGRTRSVGIFDSPEEAHAAYVEAFKKHRGGLTPRPPKNKVA